MKLTEAKGDWALVTGASSGIGREFALQLARAGMNLVLVARRAEELEKVAQSVRAQSQVQARVVAIDLAAKDSAEQLRQRLAHDGIRVRLLVNNAGLGRWGRFEGSDAGAYQDIIGVNTAAMVAMCHHFMADLASFPSSAVINVSSQASYHPIPYMGVYAATKAFVHSFSQALHCEWKARGILVQTLVPGPTESEFDARAGAYESALTRRYPPSVAVGASLAGLARRLPVVVSAKGTWSQRFFATVLPSGMFLGEVAKRFKPPPQ
jgi:short-subunit dehydrogenase